MSPRAALPFIVLFLALGLGLPADGWARNPGRSSGQPGVRHGGQARSGGSHRGEGPYRGGGHHRRGGHYRRGTPYRQGGYSIHLGYYGYYPPYYHGNLHHPYYYGYYPGPYFYGPAYAVPPGFLGALDLDVKPKTTEVYVNGDYIGTTDNFDGFPRYLWMPEGSYEVIFYRDGYETLVKRYGIRPGAVGKVRFKMKEGTSTPPEELTAFPLETGLETEGEFPR